MKRAYLASGLLTKDAKLQDNVFTVDTALYTYVSGLLGGDYCYLVISREVVRVLGTQAPNQFLVTRAVEGLRGKYLAGESIKYSLTSSELVDATVAGGLNVAVTGAIQYNGGTVKYPEVEVLGLGGIVINGYFIQDIPDNAGCAAPSTPPDIPLSYFNLRTVTQGYYRRTVDGGYRGCI